MPRIDSYTNLDNTTVATDDEFVVWDTSGSQVANLPLSALDVRMRLKRLSWAPTNTIDETTTRITALSSQPALTSGTLTVFGGIVIPNGATVTNITLASAGTGAGTPTNQWFCLIKADDLTILGKTNDDTTTAWALNSRKTLTLTTPYVASADVPVYVGVCVVASTPNNLSGVTSQLGSGGASPIVCGTANTGLTTPASLVSVSAITHGYGVAWAAVS
jgi:hypothetical protein